MTVRCASADEIRSVAGHCHFQFRAEAADGDWEQVAVFGPDDPRDTRRKESVAQDGDMVVHVAFVMRKVT